MVFAACTLLFLPEFRKQEGRRIEEKVWSGGKENGGFLDPMENGPFPSHLLFLFESKERKEVEGEQWLAHHWLRRVLFWVQEYLVLTLEQDELLLRSTGSPLRRSV